MCKKEVAYRFMAAEVGSQILAIDLARPSGLTAKNMKCRSCSAMVLLCTCTSCFLLFEPLLGCLDFGKRSTFFDVIVSWRAAAFSHTSAIAEDSMIPTVSEHKTPDSKPKSHPRAWLLAAKAPIKPLPGVTCIQSDITTEKPGPRPGLPGSGVQRVLRCRSLLRKELKGSRADVVLHDGAPNVGPGLWSRFLSELTLLHRAWLAAVDEAVPGPRTPSAKRSRLALAWQLPQSREVQGHLAAPRLTLHSLRLACLRLSVAQPCPARRESWSS